MGKAGKAPKAIKITSMSVADAAQVLSSAYGQRVTEEQVRVLAERGGLLRPSAADSGGGTINLLEYVAYVIREVSHGGDGND